MRKVLVPLSKLALGSRLRRALSRKPVLLALGAGGCLALLLTVAWLVGDRHLLTRWVAALDRATFDVQQRLFARDAPENVLVIGVGPSDENPSTGTELPRTLLNDLIVQARDAGASVIVLNVPLEASGDPGADSAFARLLARGADVVLPADLRRQPKDRGWTRLLDDSKPRLPPPLFAEAAAAVGITTALADADSVIRRSRVRDHVYGVPYWSLAVEALRVHKDVPWHEITLDDGTLHIGDRTIDSGSSYYIDHRRARVPFSLRNLLRGGGLSDRVRHLFQDAIVIVGSGPAVDQEVATPLYPSIPRIFNEVSDLATLMDGTVRHDAPAIVQIILVWVLALLGGVVFFLQPPRVTILIWAAGWILLPAIIVITFVMGTVIDAAGPLLAWTAIFPIALGYRLHLSSVDVIARNRSIEAIARLRNVRFEESRLAETLTPLLKTLADALGTHSVLLLQEGRHYWEVVGGVGAPPHDWKELRRVVSRGDDEPVLGPGGSEAYVPIVVDEDERRRVLYVRGEHSLGSLDMHTLQSVASGLHLGFHNRSLTRTLEEAYLGILTTISAAVEARDRGTEAHCQRLATYSCALAMHFDYDDEFLEELWVGAMLHDIGKIGIPDAIFLKPGKLTKEEHRVMQQHTVLGFQILENAPISESAKLCVLHHHERWDGTGYPHGLSGENIPRSARLVAVADIFDALTADRVYRAAKSEEEALEILRTEAGRGLEPELVECFEALHRRGMVRGASRPIPETARRGWSPRRHQAEIHRPSPLVAIS